MVCAKRCRWRRGATFYANPCKRRRRGRRCQERPRTRPGVSDFYGELHGLLRGWFEGGGNRFLSLREKNPTRGRCRNKRRAASFGARSRAPRRAGRRTRRVPAHHTVARGSYVASARRRSAKGPGGTRSRRVLRRRTRSVACRVGISRRSGVDDPCERVLRGTRAQAAHSGPVKPHQTEIRPLGG